jgi:hypothetical protein
MNVLILAPSRGVKGRGDPWKATLPLVACHDDAT